MKLYQVLIKTDEDLYSIGIYDTEKRALELYHNYDYKPDEKLQRYHSDFDELIITELELNEESNSKVLYRRPIIRSWG